LRSLSTNETISFLLAFTGKTGVEFMPAGVIPCGTAAIAGVAALAGATDRGSSKSEPAAPTARTVPATRRSDLCAWFKM
jgi:hypothetical protein